MLSSTDSWDVAAVNSLLDICHLVGKYPLSKCFRGVQARSCGSTLSILALQASVSLSVT